MRPYRQNSRKKPSNDSKTTNHHTNRSLKRSNQKTTRKTQSKESVPREARNKITATPAQNRHCSRPLSSYQTANPPQKTRNAKKRAPRLKRRKPSPNETAREPKNMLIPRPSKTFRVSKPQTKRKQNEAEKPAQTAPKKLRRKEVIQPHLPVRLPCYDLVPIASLTLDGSPQKGQAAGFGRYPLS